MGCLVYVHCSVTISSRWGDFNFPISSRAPFEYAVSLAGLAPGARSSTLRFFASTTSAPRIEPHAFDRFFASFTTSRMLLPTFVLLPLNCGLPERRLSLFSSLSRSSVTCNESNIFASSFDFETDSIWSETMIGNDSIFPKLWPRIFTNVADEVAAIAEHSASLFSFLLSSLCTTFSATGGCACLPFLTIATPPPWPCLPPPPPRIRATLAAWWPVGGLFDSATTSMPAFGYLPWIWNPCDSRWMYALWIRSLLIGVLKTNGRSTSPSFVPDTEKT